MIVGGTEVFQALKAGARGGASLRGLAKGEAATVPVMPWFRARLGPPRWSGLSSRSKKGLRREAAGRNLGKSERSGERGSGKSKRRTRPWFLWCRLLLFVGGKFSGPIPRRGSAYIVRGKGFLSAECKGNRTEKIVLLEKKKF